MMRITMPRLLVLIVAVGALLRLHSIDLPFDFHTWNPWREADYTQIARSFYREGMNPFLPRVDWRGDTPGFVEMEFPFIPYSAALLYNVVGYKEQLLRILSALAGVGALVVFARLVRRLLDPLGCVLATSLFAFNGLMLALSGSIQPESLQMLIVLLCIDQVCLWYHKPTRSRLLVIGTVCGLAILAKSPAALCGFVIAYAVLRKMGYRAFRDGGVYLAGIIAVGTPMLWYVWAHGLYAETGLSLGVSNETHFINAGILRDPLPTVIGLVSLEARDVLGWLGWLLFIPALMHMRKQVEIPAIWYAAGWVFYVVTADTSADGWAFYYHCSSVPPACLLMGAGASFVYYAAEAKRPGVLRWLWRGAGLGLCTFILIANVSYARHLRWKVNHDATLADMYHCVKHFAAEIPADKQVITRGGSRFDAHGHQVAYNESMIFAWMDRRGSNYAEEDFTPAKLRSLHRQGAMFWIAREADMRDSSVFCAVVSECTLLDSCGSFRLFRMQRNNQQ